MFGVLDYNFYLENDVFRLFAESVRRSPSVNPEQETFLESFETFLADVLLAAE